MNDMRCNTLFIRELNTHNVPSYGSHREGWSDSYGANGIGIIVCHKQDAVEEVKGEPSGPSESGSHTPRDEAAVKGIALASRLGVVGDTRDKERLGLRGVKVHCIYGLGPFVTDVQGEGGGIQGHAPNVSKHIEEGGEDHHQGWGLRGHN